MTPSDIEALLAEADAYEACVKNPGSSPSLVADLAAALRECAEERSALHGYIDHLRDSELQMHKALYRITSGRANTLEAVIATARWGLCPSKFPDPELAIDAALRECAEDAVPREPTKAMLTAGTIVFMRERQKMIPKWDPEIAGRFWQAMYDAARREGRG